jgi:hypothetical protein
MKWITIFILLFTLQVFGQQHNNLFGTDSAPTDSLRDGNTTITSSVVWYKVASELKGGLTLSIKPAQVAGSFNTITPYIRIFTKPNDATSYSKWYALSTITAVPTDPNEAVVYAIAQESWYTYHYGYETKLVTGAGTGNWRTDVEAWGNVN